MSLIPLGFFAASGGAAFSYYISLLGGTGQEYAEDLIIDSAGRLVTNGRYGSSGGIGSADYYLTALNTDGTVALEKAFGTGGADYGYRVAVDSSDNIYIGGRDGSNMVLGKFDSAGSLLGQVLVDQGGYDQISGGVRVDGSGNIYLAGLSNALGANNNFLVCLNSSFAIQWQRILKPTSGASTWGFLELDASANSYVVGQTQGTTAGLYDGLVAKYNSSGVLQWQRRIGGTGNDYGKGIAVDSSGNVYAAVQWTSGTNKSLLVKFDSSGGTVWQRYMGNGTGSTYPARVSVDASDNVYVAGVTNETGAGGDDWFVAKYSAGGTIQWQRSIGSSGTDSLLGLDVDADSNIYLAGFTGAAGSGSDDNMYAVIPGDGSLTATVTLDGVNFVYQASSLTEGAGTATIAAASNTDNAGSATASTPSFTAATVTNTQYLETL